MTVTFYEQGGTEIGTNTVTGSGIASVVWTGANQPETTYHWYTVADDGTDSTTSPTWSFTTGTQTTPGGMYVWDISWTTGRHLRSTVTIRRDSDGDGVAEASDELVNGAVVYFTLTHQPTGDYTDYVDTTGDAGTVTFTWKHAPSGSYAGLVTDVTHSSYTYDSTLDVDNPDYFTK
jgi:hypothetical protein